MGTNRNIRFHPLPDSWCPKCRAPEVDPEQDRLFIRGLKVYDEHGAWSQCLVCAGYYTRHDDGTLTYHQEQGNPAKGWFSDKGVA